MCDVIVYGTTDDFLSLFEGALSKTNYMISEQSTTHV